MSDPRLPTPGATTAGGATPLLGVASPPVVPNRGREPRRASHPTVGAPRPESKTGLVYRVLQEAPLPYPSVSALEARLGLTAAEVRGARARVFRHRYLPAPAQPERSKALSRQRGSVWPEIELFVRLGMRPAEVQVAVQQLTGVELDATRIATAFGKRTRKGLPLRAPDERRQARIEALQDTVEQRERRVALWLDALARLLLEGRSAGWPVSRGAWLALVDDYQTRGFVTPQAGHLHELIRLHEVNQRPLLPGMSEDVAGEIAFLRQARDAEEAEAGLRLLCRVLPADQVPTSPFDRDYLITICRYLDELGRTGQRSLLYDPTVYERLDATLRGRVQAQVAVIRARYAWHEVDGTNR